MAVTSWMVIRNDIKELHIDLVFAEKNSVRWALTIMWLVSADLIHSLFHFGALLSFVIAFFVVGIYRIFDVFVILKGVEQSKETLKAYWRPEFGPENGEEGGDLNGSNSQRKD